METLDARELPAVAAFSFALPDGSNAVGQATITDESIDVTAASQTLSAQDISLDVGGVTYTAADLSPNVTVEYSLGAFAGVSLSLPALASGSPYSSISLQGGVATINAVQQLFTSPITLNQNSVTLNFNTITTGKPYYLVVVIDTGAVQQGRRVPGFRQEQQVGATATPEEIRDSIYAALIAEGFGAIRSGTTSLVILGRPSGGTLPAAPLIGVHVGVGFTSGPTGVTLDNTLKGPAVTSLGTNAVSSINGLPQQVVPPAVNMGTAGGGQTVNYYLDILKK